MDFTVATECESTATARQRENAGKVRLKAASRKRRLRDVIEKQTAAGWHIAAGGCLTSRMTKDVIGVIARNAI